MGRRDDVLPPLRAPILVAFGADAAMLWGREG